MFNCINTLLFYINVLVPDDERRILLNVNEINFSCIRERVKCN